MAEQKLSSVSIYDIAKETGFSAATVSRVLSGSDYPVSQAAREQILSCAQVLGYVCRSRRNTARGTATAIGVILPTCTNPSYAQVTQGIVSKAQQEGAQACFCYTSRSPEQEHRAVQTLQRNKAQGLIVSTSMPDTSYWESLAEHGVPIVLVDQNAHAAKCSRVTVDLTKSAMQAIDYLAEMGHRRIALLSTPLTKPSREEVFLGFRMGLLRNHLEWEEELAIILQEKEEGLDENFEFESGRMLARRFLQLSKRPTALLAVNDMTAIGAMQFLVHEAGLRIPEDVSIVGIDNIEMSGMMSPPLTTVAVPSMEIGRMAVQLLLDCIRQREPHRLSLSLDTQLMLRGSVRPLSGAGAVFPETKPKTI